MFDISDNSGDVFVLSTVTSVVFNIHIHYLCSWESVSIYFVQVLDGRHKPYEQDIL